MPLHLLPDTAYTYIVDLLGPEPDHDDDRDDSTVFYYESRDKAMGTVNVVMSKDLKALCLVAKWFLRVVRREVTHLFLSLKLRPDFDRSTIVRLLHWQCLREITINYPAMLFTVARAVMQADRGFVNLTAFKGRWRRKTASSEHMGYLAKVVESACLL